MSKQFKIARFQVNDPVAAGHTKAAVCLPTQAFRVHPDPARRIKNVLISWLDNGWHLVDPDARQALVDVGHSVLVATLYEVVRANGQRIVMPITLSASGNGWTSSARDMIGEARQCWIARESDSANQRHVFRRVSGIDHEPVWSDDFEALVEDAFGERIVTLDHPLLNRQKKASRGYDEIEDEFM